MTLVERLLELDEKGYGPRTGSVGAEAAAEIARLESALAGEKNLTLSLAADIARLHASLPAAEDARDAAAMPSDGKTLQVELFYLKDNDPFVCGAIGHVTADGIARIEKDVNEDPESLFKHGEGSYLFNASWFAGQYDEQGRCEFPSGYELDLVSYRAIVQEAAPAMSQDSKGEV